MCRLPSSILPAHARLSTPVAAETAVEPALRRNARHLRAFPSGSGATRAALEATSTDREPAPVGPAHNASGGRDRVRRAFAAHDQLHSRLAGGGRAHSIPQGQAGGRAGRRELSEHPARGPADADRSGFVHVRRPWHARRRRSTSPGRTAARTPTIFCGG